MGRSNNRQICKGPQNKSYYANALDLVRSHFFIFIYQQLYSVTLNKGLSMSDQRSIISFTQILTSGKLSYALVSLRHMMSYNVNRVTITSFVTTWGYASYM
jgi:hypothetical protein